MYRRPMVRAGVVCRNLWNTRTRSENEASQEGDNVKKAYVDAKERWS
jgi:hypothetical protein